MSKAKQTLWLTGKGMVIFCLIAFASYLLFVEHANHLVGWLPYLILLLCPLIHLFMHGGHGGHGQHHDTDEKAKKAEQTDEYKLGYIAATKAQEKLNEHKSIQERDEHGRE